MCWKGIDGSYDKENIPLKHEKKWSENIYFFNPNSTISEMAQLFGRFPGLAIFLLVRATCRWRWVWSVGGMILTGGNRNSERETCPNVTVTFTKLTWADRDQTRAYAVWGRPLTAWTVTCLFVCLSLKLNLFCIKTRTLPRSKHTPSQL